MSNQLKSFFQRHKEKFDSEIPAASVWERIEKNITVKPKVFTLKEVYRWSAAAAVLCIVLTSFYFLLLRKKETQLRVVTTASKEKKLPDEIQEISTYAPEYAAEAQQIFYAIEASRQELQREAKPEPGLHKEFAADLKVLDSSYQQLKDQAALSPNRDIIIKAMLDNLHLQAELLARQLVIMNNLKETKTVNNEKNKNLSL